MDAMRRLSRRGRKRMRRRQRWLRTPLGVRFAHSLDVHRGVGEDIRGDEGQKRKLCHFGRFLTAQAYYRKANPIKDMRATERQINYRDDLGCLVAINVSWKSRFCKQSLSTWYCFAGAMNVRAEDQDRGILVIRDFVVRPRSTNTSKPHTRSVDNTTD